MKTTGLRLLLGIFLSGILPTAVQAAEKYIIDASHTNIGFSVRHMGLSNVKGSFKDFSGEINYDEKDITKSSASVTIKTASIDTQNKDRDDHLRNADFFDAPKYPEITFKSKEVVKKGDGLVMKGTFTMKGVSKEIEIPFQFVGAIVDPWGNKRLGAEGGLTINRQDYKISFSKMLDKGGLMVGNDVKIDLAVEAVVPKADEAKKK